MFTVYLYQRRIGAVLNSEVINGQVCSMYLYVKCYKSFSTCSPCSIPKNTNVMCTSNSFMTCPVVKTTGFMLQVAAVTTILK